MGHSAIVILNPQAATVVTTEDITNVVTSVTLGQVTVNPAVVQVTTIPTAPVVVVTGGTGALAASVLDIRRIFELGALFRVASLTGYKEMSYTGSKLVAVDVWDTSGKVTKFFSRILTYTGANLVGVVTTNDVTAEILTRTLTYAAGKLDTVTDTITP